MSPKAEYEARKRTPEHKRALLKPLLLLIDEFNELLDYLDKKSNEYVCKVLRTLIRGGRKHGIIVCLIAQNWDLSSTGGRQVRTNIACKLTTPADPLELKLILNINDDKRIAALPHIRKGQAHCNRLGHRLMQLSYPHVNREFCEMIAEGISELEPIRSNEGVS